MTIWRQWTFNQGTAMPKSKPGSVQRQRDNQRAYARARKKWLVIERQSGLCAVCHKKRRLTIDHVVPLAKGGTNELDNLRAICNPCRIEHDQSMGDGANFHIRDWRKWGRPEGTTDRSPTGEDT